MNRISFQISNVSFLLERCLRIKRKHQTYFIRTSLNKTVSSLKASLAEAIRNSLANDMKLFKSKDETTMLIDETLLTENGIKDDEVLFLVLRDGNDWETIDIVESE